ncbi:MAG: hypothetical protein ACU0CT_03540 [Paracoccaceae bacterium]
MQVEIRTPRENMTGGIDCEIKIGGEWLPFTARADDCAEHGRQIYAVAREAISEEVRP